MARPGRLGGIASLLVALWVEAPAAAQAPAPPAAHADAAPGQEERRTAIYRDAVDAATAGRWADARDRFREALAIRSSPKVLFSLAQAEEHVGQVASADADYGRALEGAKAAGETEVVAAAERARRAIEPRVPHVRVVVSGAGGATATLDEQPVAVGVGVAVDPGAHRLVVSAPGMGDATTNVAIGEHQQLDVPVHLELADGVRAPPASLQGPATSPPAGAETGPTATGRAAPWRTVGLVTGGAGLVGLGVGTVLGLVAKSKNDQSNTSGCTGNDCTAAAAAVRRDALSAASGSTVAFLVGGALAAGGVVLWLVAPTGERDHGVGVTPVALGGGCGVAITGGWR